jgi:nucleoside-diphosphate-sugar epimerase
MVETKRILVTGASGLIGAAVCRLLAAEDRYEIVALGGRKDAPPFGDGEQRIARLKADITAEQDLERLDVGDRIDVVVHAAGLAHQFGKIGRADFFRVNANGAGAVCRLAARLGAARVIALSSVAVYGRHGRRTVTEDFACRPEGAYAESKLAGERKAATVCGELRLGLTTLRLATVVGEEDAGNIMRLITQIDNRRFIWIGDGSNRKTLIDKTDVASAVRKVIEAGEKPSKDERDGIYNLAAGTIEMREVVETIAAALGRKIPRLRIPARLLTAAAKLNRRSLRLGKISAFEKTLEKWTADDMYSGQKFFEKFDFAPSSTIAAALEREVGHYLATKNAK